MSNTAAGDTERRGDACAMQISSQSPAIESEFHTILYVWIHENFDEIHTSGGKSDKNADYARKTCLIAAKAAGHRPQGGEKIRENEIGMGLPMPQQIPAGAKGALLSF